MQVAMSSMVFALLLGGCTSDPGSVEDGDVAGASSAPAGDPSAFVLLDVDPQTGLPIRFNPCRPIHYVMNPTSAPPGAVQVVREVIPQVAAATGIEFVDDGTTDEVLDVQVRADGIEVRNRAAYQPDRYGADRWAPLIITWQPFGRNSGGRAHVAGGGGAVRARTPQGGWVAVSGTVVMDAAQTRKIFRTATMHELGHVMGLDHVDDRSQVMSPSSKRTTWGAGDLEGLRQLGRASGCLPEVAPGHGRG